MLNWSSTFTCCPELSWELPRCLISTRITSQSRETVTERKMTTATHKPLGQLHNRPQALCRRGGGGKSDKDNIRPATLSVPPPPLILPVLGLFVDFLRYFQNESKEAKFAAFSKSLGAGPFLTTLPIPIFTIYNFQQKSWKHP